MISNRVKTFTKSLAVAACAYAVTSYTPAMAADLGGDCCADLEERVAELEATTARKGNRKVSLTIYGHVNNALMLWDDGFDDNAYVVGNLNSPSRFGFKGKAKITSDWSAGYKIEIQVDSPGRSDKHNQDDDDGNEGNLAIRKAYWYLKSKTFGKVSVGQNSTAIDDLTHWGWYHAAYGQATQKTSNGFFLRSSPTSDDGTWSNVTSNFDGPRGEIVRYDTPTIAGFVGTASWGEDDYWDVALRYAGKLGDFKVKAAVGYGEDEDEKDDEHFKASGVITHMPTGLFVYGAFTSTDHNDVENADEEGYAIAVGIIQKFNSLGKTSVWGMYTNSEDVGAGLNQEWAYGHDWDDVRSTEAERWDIGIAQSIDAAAMKIYAVYQHSELDVDVVQHSNLKFEDLDTFTAGAVIKF